MKLKQLFGATLLTVSVIATTTLMGQMSPSNPDTTASPGMTTSSAPQMSNPEVLIDPGRIYNAKTPSQWVGRSVVLQNVMVQDTNDDGNFWVGSDSDHRLLVVKGDSANLSALRVHKGDVVTVSGTIQPSSRYVAEQTSSSQGSMKDASKSSGVILLASDMSVGSSTRRK